MGHCLHDLGLNKETADCDLQSVAKFWYLHEGVPAVGGLLGAEGLSDSLSVGHKGPMRQAVGQDRPLHLSGERMLKSSQERRRIHS